MCNGIYSDRNLTNGLLRHQAERTCQKVGGIPSLEGPGLLLSLRDHSSYLQDNKGRHPLRFDKVKQIPDCVMLREQSFYLPSISTFIHFYGQIKKTVSYYP